MLEAIAEDPVLRHTKIIAEAWDAAGAYQVGWFPGGRWAEWNDRYRDDVRRFWRGDDIPVGSLATRITGSSDLYLRDGRKPFHSINFITSHDGFTLNDLVSYTHKHNEMNGEENRDGSDNNLSANCGIEGEASAGDPADDLRRRQIKNFMATLLLSLGTPMFLGGDELRRTQKGNNNAYCQNNEISWLDWKLTEASSDIRSFISRLIRFRFSHPALLRPEFFTGKDERFNAMPDIAWFDEKGKTPNWEKQKKLLALRIDGHEASMEWDKDSRDLYMMFNSSSQGRVFSVAPPRQGLSWHRLIDTGLEAPEDFVEEENAPALLPQNRYRVTSQSFVLLMAK